MLDLMKFDIMWVEIASDSKEMSEGVSYLSKLKFLRKIFDRFGKATKVRRFLGVN